MKQNAQLLYRPMRTPWMVFLELSKAGAAIFTLNLKLSFQIAKRIFTVFVISCH